MALLQQLITGRKYKFQNDTFWLSRLLALCTKLNNMEHKTRQCPYCAETIHIDAAKCKHCRELLTETLNIENAQPLAVPYVSTTTIIEQKPDRKWSPGIAAVLSLFIPGLGQMYKGHVLAGLFWLIVTPAGYFLLLIPGLVLHLICIIAASMGDPYK